MADNLIINDGQYDWSGGMDSSRSPLNSVKNSLRVGINVTMRGGRAKTRPGFQQVFLTDDPDYPGSLALFSSGKKITVSNGNAFSEKTGNYFQGAFFYVNKTTPDLSCLIVVSGGYVFRISPVQGYVSRLNILANPGSTRYTGLISNAPTYPDGLFRVDATKKVYFCQAEKYLIMQNGNDRPWVWDGDTLFQTGVGSNINDASAVNILSASMPIGTYMAYGQGRLFVASPTKDSFTAGDIVFGGSSNQIPIVQSYQGAYGQVQTQTVHGFATRDVVSISGHSSTPNINGTWRVLGTNDTFIQLSTPITNAGVGGFVVKAQAGQESDLLRFTETAFLNEGGFLQIPSQMGSIRGLSFMPTGDTATGQGELLVFGESGVSSFAVSVPRDMWKSTPGFQRVALSGIGLTSDKTVVAINNDLFFRSLDGLRTYRNARSQQEGYNVTPISTEMDIVLDYDTESLLSSGSAVYHDNRLLFTVSPRENLENIEAEPIKVRPISFQGIGVLDFNSLGTSGEKQPAIFDGVWTGLEVLQLVTGITNRLPRCFVFSYDNTSNSNTLWENYPWALFDYPLGQSAKKIQAAIETRAYDFSSPWNLKKLERGDMWIGELAGDTKVNVYYRPDENPCWFPWHSFNTCSELESCITSVADVNAAEGFQTVKASGKTVERAITWRLNFKDQKDFYIRLANTTGSRVGNTATNAVERSYLNTLSEINTSILTWPVTPDQIAVAINSALWSGFATLPATGTYLWLYAAAGLVDASIPTDMYVQFRLGNVAFNASTGSTTILNTGTSYVPLEAPVAIVAAEDCGFYKPLNIKDQYRSQLRLPTPDNSCVTSTGTLARVGHSFQFRYEWEGQFALNKIMFHASKLVEPVSGNCL